jgi:hypothetical protein
MKNNLIAAVLVFGFASSAMAADGDVKIQANVSNSLSMSFDSGDVLVGGAAQDGVLDHTIDFGDVAATATATSLVERVVSLRLRSNVGYVLKATATVTAGAGADTDALGLEDIGFGVTAITPAAAGGSGTTLVSGDHTADATTYDYDPGTADVTTGEVSFTKDLEDVTTDDLIAEGDRISKGGNVKSQTNFIKVDTKYAILPQFFTPVTSFVAVVNYTLSAAP